MKGPIANRKPVGAPVTNDNVGSPVTTGAYLQLAASLAAPASGILAVNTGTHPVKLAVGAGGSEVDLGIVVPPGVPIEAPVELKKGQRLSARGVGTANTNSGYLVITFLG
jgi:hypothetical protein